MIWLSCYGFWDKKGQREPQNVKCLDKTSEDVKIKLEFVLERENK